MRAYRFDQVTFDPEAIALGRDSIQRAGMLVVGEPHGVRETPSMLYALARVLGTRALAFEWAHEEMDEPVQGFMEAGDFDFERLWSLPRSAEFFCGDGRITAGHFALLHRMREEDRLEQVIVFDRLDPEPPQDDWRVREREMAERLLSERDERLPLLVLTGALHARLDGPQGEPMAALLRRRVPGLETAMLDYERGECWFRGELHDVSGPMPDAPIRLRVPAGSPAVVPGMARA